MKAQGEETGRPPLCGQTKPAGRLALWIRGRALPGDRTPEKGLTSIMSIADTKALTADAFESLLNEPRWVCWRYADRDGRRTKLPVDPNTGKAARPNGPETWGTYAEAANMCSGNPGMSGVGIMLGNGLAGIDIDHCRNPQTGVLSDLAQDVVSMMDCYAEVSPSGTGLHMLFLADPQDLPWNRHSNAPEFECAAQEIEIYQSGRYFTVTGKALDPYNVRPIADRTDALRAVADKYPKTSRQQTEERKAQDAPPSPVPSDLTGEGAGHYRSGMTPEDYRDWMCGWKNGAEIRALFAGDLSAHDGDDSKADFALIHAIAFATRHESEGRAGLIERIFSLSVLADRDKWRGREDYRTRTIENALQSAPYEPWTEILPSGVGTGGTGQPKTGQTDNPDGPRIMAGVLAAEYALGQYAADIERFSANRDRTTGFYNLDQLRDSDGTRYSNPLRSGVYVLGAITSLGKTTFITQMAEHLATNGSAVLYYTLEQSALDIYSKGIARRMYQLDPLTALSSVEIREGVTSEEVHAAERAYRDGPAQNLRIIAGAFGTRPMDIDATARHIAAQSSRPPIVVIDYLQALAPDNPRDTEKMALDRAMRTLKTLNIDTGATIIAISSLNRANYLLPVEFESFKESGGTEFTADAMWGLELGCLSHPLFGKEGKVQQKRRVVGMAKLQKPREIRLRVLKNRFGLSGGEALFYYRPQNEYFWDVPDLEISRDGDFPRVMGERTWRDLADSYMRRGISGCIADPEDAGSDAQDNRKTPEKTGDQVYLTREIVDGWTPSYAKKVYASLTAPEKRGSLDGLDAKTAKAALLDSIGMFGLEFDTYSDTIITQADIDLLQK